MFRISKSCLLAFSESLAARDGYKVRSGSCNSKDRGKKNVEFWHNLLNFDILSSRAHFDL